MSRTTGSHVQVSVGDDFLALSCRQAYRRLVSNAHGNGALVAHYPRSIESQLVQSIHLFAVQYEINGMDVG
jgi:hypothetical protein